MDPAWSEPFDVSGVPCHMALHNGGWLICSPRRPYFCFEADTAQQARDTAGRAIALWRTREKS